LRLADLVDFCNPLSNSLKRMLVRVVELLQFSASKYPRTSDRNSHTRSKSAALLVAFAAGVSL
jgi:hypothetical protein